MPMQWDVYHALTAQSASAKNCLKPHRRQFSGWVCRAQWSRCDGSETKATLRTTIREIDERVTESRAKLADLDRRIVQGDTAISGTRWQRRTKVALAVC
jgi:hypothetical protein